MKCLIYVYISRTIISHFIGYETLIDEHQNCLLLASHSVAHLEIQLCYEQIELLATRVCLTRTKFGINLGTHVTIVFFYGQRKALISTIKLVATLITSFTILKHGVDIHWKSTKIYVYVKICMNIYTLPKYSDPTRYKCVKANGGNGKINKPRLKNYGNYTSQENQMNSSNYNTIEIIIHIYTHKYIHIC